jgi:hypothetical protein
MANGGRWLFSIAGTPIVLGINNGVAPVFPAAQDNAFNIEVFTNPTVSGVPGPQPGFHATIADPGGTLENGFLTGTSLHLGGGDLLVVDSPIGAAGQSPAMIRLGGGNQTVIGAKFDTLIGGAGAQILSALSGDQTVIGGSGDASIWGGANDSIVAGTGGEQIVVTGAGSTIVAGMSGTATIAAAAQNTIRSLSGSTQRVVVAAGMNNLVDLTGNNGLTAVLGASGDTIIAGGGATNIDGTNGGMLIKIGAAGVTNVSGSAGAVAGNTIRGGAGAFAFNPGATAGSGDLIDLSGSSGAATVNAFAFGATRIASHDTILASNLAVSVFGGDGDRIGTGSGSVVGGFHQWVHADTVAGSAVGFGSNDTVVSTTYDTVAGFATRGSVAGTSSAQVTVGGFNASTDFIFYQNEDQTTSGAIVATTQTITVEGQASSMITLPDGTVMTLVGITQAQLQSALLAGTLFKP